LALTIGAAPPPVSLVMEVVALPSAAKDWSGAIKPVAKISVKRVKILPQYFAFLIFFELSLTLF
jgi:hypothetical protein